MRIAAALALLLLFVAGCTSTQQSVDTSAPGSAATPALHWRAPVDLGSKARAGAFGTNCMDSAVDGDCGLGEPEVEVDSQGTVYVSGTCCLTIAPPVYVSRDGGATFHNLSTPMGVREAFGIEGDFAIDGKGRVYFSDIEFAATFQVTVWDKDGTYERHTKWPAPPLVDRDWIRAEGDGTAYYVYNTGSETHIYKSTDAAMTWSPTAVHTSSFPLGFAVLGPGGGHLAVISSAGSVRRVDETLDGGATWKLGDSTAPGGGSANVGAAFDETGHLYAASDADGRITIAHRGLDGHWDAPVTVAGPGKNTLPWVAAGRDGAVAIAWYGASDAQPDHWMLRVAVSHDHGLSWESSVADPTPVFVGDLQRQLLDFLQVEIGPDGAVHVAYSSLPDDGSKEPQLHYVRDEPDASLAAVDYANGP